jgi:hypothetical protein
MQVRFIERGKIFLIADPLFPPMQGSTWKHIFPHEFEGQDIQWPLKKMENHVLFAPFMQ